MSRTSSYSSRSSAQTSDVLSDDLIIEERVDLYVVDKLLHSRKLKELIHGDSGHDMNNTTFMDFPYKSYVNYMVVAKLCNGVIPGALFRKKLLHSNNAPKVHTRKNYQTLTL